VAPQRLTVEALVRLPNGIAMLIGMAWLEEGASVTPDSEHDDFAWWPADVERWPEHADDPLRRVAALLSTPA
jgi:8-oxo-dGTP diphosphatase